MKTAIRLAVAFVAIAGIAGAGLAAQAAQTESRRDGGPGDIQQAHRMHHGHHGGQHGMHRGGHHGGGHHGGGHMLRMMEAFDSNDDGALSQEEIDQARGARFGSFDADADQALTLDEYQQLWLDAMRERMVDHFQRLDADGDARVTGEEFQRPYAGMVRHMDRNEDGVVDRGDFRRRHHGDDDN